MKVVTLASGGIDSTLMMYMLIENKYEVHPLFVNYGQLSYNKEYESYKKICNYLKLKSSIINVSEYGKYIKSGITSKKLDVYKDAFLPNRNLLFLLLGSSYAFQNDIYVVSIGLIKDPIFPDQTLTFLNKAENCIKESLEVDMKILAPLIDFSKKEIYQLSQYYKLPIKDTYYCHLGNDEPCGKCVACKEHIAVLSEVSSGVGYIE